MVETMKIRVSIGMTRFELAASASRTQRSTKLSHIPRRINRHKRHFLLPVFLKTTISPILAQISRQLSQPIT